MAENSKIEWTDHTFNPWRGCTKVHAGCANCYAEREAKRFPQNRGIWGEHGTRVMASPDAWRAPLKWNRDAEKAGVRKRVFCASLADVFEDWQGEILDHNGNTLVREQAGDRAYKTARSDGDYLVTMSDLRRDLFALIDATPHLDWLLLTKRPENIRRMWPQIVCEMCGGTGQDPQPEDDPRCDECDGTGGIPPRRRNVWLGTSISDQATADRYVPDLVKCRDHSPVLFLSGEPLLGPTTLDLTGIDWVIVGGESGPHARPMHPDWPRALRDQCQAAGVAFHFKQHGEWLAINDMPIELLIRADSFSQTSLLFNGLRNGAITSEICRQLETLPTLLYRVGKADAGRLLDERTWDEFPQLVS